MFYSLTAMAVYSISESPNRFAHLTPLLTKLFLASTVSLWVLADLRRRRRAFAYDLGCIVFFTWPVFVPIYLFSTRRWRAFAPLGSFVLLYLAAVLVACLPSIVHSLRH